MLVWFIYIHKLKLRMSDRFQKRFFTSFYCCFLLCFTFHLSEKKIEQLLALMLALTHVASMLYPKTLKESFEQGCLKRLIFLWFLGGPIPACSDRPAHLCQGQVVVSAPDSIAPTSCGSLCPHGGDCFTRCPCSTTRLRCRICAWPGVLRLQVLNFPELSPSPREVNRVGPQPQWLSNGLPQVLVC